MGPKSIVDLQIQDKIKYRRFSSAYETGHLFNIDIEEIRILITAVKLFLRFAQLQGPGLYQSHLRV